MTFQLEPHSPEMSLARLFQVSARRVVLPRPIARTLVPAYTVQRSFCQSGMVLKAWPTSDVTYEELKPITQQPNDVCFYTVHCAV
jgi:hypothetical protein